MLKEVVDQESGNVYYESARRLPCHLARHVSRSHVASHATCPSCRAHRGLSVLPRIVARVCAAALPATC